MTNTTSPPFNALIAQTIAARTHNLPEQLIILDNSAKYCPEGIDQDVGGQSLSAIFDTMANLNRMALGDPSLCVGEHGPSFRDGLFNAVSE